MKEKSLYAELGLLLKSWRSEKYRSALALFNEVEFSFSYSTYADFERGLALPSPKILVEISNALKKDEKEALLVWAQAQMPTPELKDYFGGISRRSLPQFHVERRASLVKSSSMAAPSLDNTWALGAQELQILRQAPYVWEALLCIAMAYPDEVPNDQLRGTGIEEHLEPMIIAGHLVRTETGMKLRQQHLHIPRTQEWDEIRKSNISRALHALVDAGPVYRELVHRPLSQEQAMKWANALKNLENEFKSDSYSNGETHALLMVLGKRKLTK